MKKLKLKTSFALALVALLVLPMVFACFQTTAKAAPQVGGGGDTSYTEYNGGSRGSGEGSTTPGSGGGSSGGGSSGGGSSGGGSTPAPTNPPSGGGGSGGGGSDRDYDYPANPTITITKSGQGSVDLAKRVAAWEYDEYGDRYRVYQYTWGYGPSYTVNEGTVVGISATASAGWYVQSITGISVANGATSYSGSKTVNASQTINVVFAPVSYTLTATADTGGTISPSGAKSVPNGSVQTYTITPSTGYKIANVTVDGVSQGAVTTINVTADANKTINATFALSTFTLTSGAGTGGTISPSGAKSVQSGSMQSYIITPATGYKVANVTVDGVSQGAVTSINVTANANKTINATFALNTYTITATAGPNGTISPSGVTTVQHGQSQTYTITPATGYEIVDVLYNGVSKGTVATFSTGAVTANGTVTATFKKKNTTDLTITSITPVHARVGLHMLSLVTCYNTGDDPVTAMLNFSAGGNTQSKTVTVPAKTSSAVAFTWLPSGLGTIPVSATINPDKAVFEIDYTNNTCTATVTVRDIVDPADPDIKTPTPINPPPNGENNSYVEWTGPQGQQYWARLTLTATADKSILKSGYGFGLTVTPTLTTNCPDPTAIIQPQAVVMRVPESHYEKGVTLVSSGGSWTLPVNPASVKGSTVWFVPVWFPDGVDYVGVVTVYGAFTPGGELTASMPVRIAINGNMYEDDSTNSVWGG